MSYSLEVDMVRLAAERDLLTTPYVFDLESTVAMTEAGADIVVAHMGLTTMGTIGAKTTAVTLEESVGKVQEIADAATAINPDVLVICHGGPIAEPSDAAYVLQNTTGVHGFYGASSAERLPTERGIREQIEEFKAISFEGDVR